jgi:hypothetical protein
MIFFYFKPVIYTLHSHAPDDEPLPGTSSERTYDFSTSISHLFPYKRHFSSSDTKVSLDFSAYSV